MKEPLPASSKSSSSQINNKLLLWHIMKDTQIKISKEAYTHTHHTCCRQILRRPCNLKYPQHSRAVISSSLVLWKTFSGVNYMPATHVASQRSQFSILILTMIAVKWGNDYFSIRNHPQRSPFVCLFLKRCWQIFNYFFKGRISLSPIEYWKFHA